MGDFRGLYNIRDFTAKDANFVLATFLRGLYYGNTWFSDIPKPIFMENYKKIALAIISSPKTVIVVACLKEDPDVILGYSMLSDDLRKIHWVFVKSAWRRKGIAKSLLPQFPTTVTHLSTVGKSLMNKLPSTIFNPFAI